MFDGSASDEDTDTAKAELQGALTHPSLKDVPVLVLVSKVDSVSPDELSKVSHFLTARALKKHQAWPRSYTGFFQQGADRAKQF